MQLLFPVTILRVAAEGQGGAPVVFSLDQIWSFGLAQVHDNAAELQAAIGAPINLSSRIHNPGSRGLPTELALLSHDRPRFRLFRGCARESAGCSANLAEVNGLRNLAISHGVEVDRCLVLVALRAKHIVSQLTPWVRRAESLAQEVTRDANRRRLHPNVSFRDTHIFSG